MNEMVLLDEALTAIVNFIDDSVDKGQMGTGGTASASSDTGLEYPDATTLFATTSSISDNQVVFTYIVAAVILPIINFMVYIEVARQMTAFLGTQMDLSNLTRMI